MQPVLKVENVKKSYTSGHDELLALSSVDFTVGDGEFVCIIGRNGSGKSTLLKIIAGILKPSAGRLSDPGEAAYLPQEPSLLPWRTVAENLRLRQDLTGKDGKAYQAKAKKLLKEFGLSKFAGFYPHELSGGMQQKVALLRTVIHNPRLLLLDEPFSALDAITRSESQKWLLDLWGKDRPAVICVTHDIREAVLLADTIYVLSDRPGTISRKITVKLPRPRRQSHLLSKEAEKLEKKLNRLLAIKQ